LTLEREFFVEVLRQRPGGHGAVRPHEGPPWPPVFRDDLPHEREASLARSSEPGARRLRVVALRFRSDRLIFTLRVEKLGTPRWQPHSTRVRLGAEHQREGERQHVRRR
jgi:hypothetical protein